MFRGIKINSEFCLVLAIGVLMILHFAGVSKVPLLQVSSLGMYGMLAVGCALTLIPATANSRKVIKVSLVILSLGLLFYIGLPPKAYGQQPHALFTPVSMFEEMDGYNPYVDKPLSKMSDHERCVHFATGRKKWTEEGEKETAKYCMIGAESGDPYSQRTISNMYYAGKGGLPQSYEEAYYWNEVIIQHTKGGRERQALSANEQMAILLTKEQLSNAEQRAKAWKPQKTEKPRE